jgi:hypothetical protein
MDLKIQSNVEEVLIVEEKLHEKIFFGNKEERRKCFMI